MSLKPSPLQPIPEQTAQIARAAFPKGSVYLTLRDQLGTLSAGIHNSGMRRSRFIGLAKTHLQNVAIAASLNVCRLVAWLEGVPRSTTRVSPFARLCAPLALTA